MLVMDGDGAGASTYATGLRNSAGFDWHPVSGNLYATDNGRDLLGDDLPNCELNHIVEGGFYGWPHAYDDNVYDDEVGLGFEDKVATAIAPAHGFGGHRAPLGMRFIKGEGDLQNKALVALHGSWNHSQLVGYKVVSLDFAADGSITQQDFITGFAEGDDVIGRPVEIIEGPDGAIYISDDYIGVIYRVTSGDMTTSGGVTAQAPRMADPLAGISSDEVDMYATLGRELYGSSNCVECHEMSATGIEIKELVDLGAGVQAAVWGERAQHKRGCVAKRSGQRAGAEVVGPDGDFAVGEGPKGHPGVRGVKGDIGRPPQLAAREVETDEDQAAQAQHQQRPPPGLEHLPQESGEAALPDLQQDEAKERQDDQPGTDGVSHSKRYAFVPHLIQKDLKGAVSQ